MKSIQTEQFQFDYFILKTEAQPTDFGSVQFGLVILYFKKIILFFGGFFNFLMGLVSVCSVFFGSVFFRFGLVFRFRLLKPKLNRTKYFFKYYNRFNQFFFMMDFFDYFFYLISFLVFFLVSKHNSKYL